MSRHFEKYCFELKENEERQPPSWKTRVKYSKIYTKIVSGKQQRKAMAISNSIRNNNNLAQSNAYPKYLYTLPGLVEDPDDNTHYDFSHLLQNKLSTGKLEPKRNQHQPKQNPKQ